MRTTLATWTLWTLAAYSAQGRATPFRREGEQLEQLVMAAGDITPE